ncbi:MAG: hypothetical protein ABEK17_03210, partial [Candidatus Aenigmatarchaeota archaeon]
LFSDKIEKSGKHRSKGILITSFKTNKGKKSLKDICPSILDIFEIEIPKDMGGKSQLIKN